MSVQSQIERLTAIKERIRTNLVAQGIVVPADAMLEDMATQILSVAGEDGKDGANGLSIHILANDAELTYNASNDSYTTDPYHFLDDTEIQIHDLVVYSQDGSTFGAYKIGYKTNSTIRLNKIALIKTPVKGADYFTAADKADMVAQVKAALTTENWTFTLENGSTVTKAVYVG